MRQRRVGLVIAGIGLFGLLTMYVSPIVVALRLPAVATADAAVPLPSLRVPALPIPTLAEPKLAAPAASPSTRKAVTASAAPQQQRSRPAAAAPAAAAAAPARPAPAAETVPVVTDQYSLTPEAAAPAPAAEQDPFAELPIVDDAIGTIPVTTAAPSGAVAAPAAAPPAAADAVSSEPAATATPADELAELEAARAAQHPSQPASVTYTEPVVTEEPAADAGTGQIAPETEVVVESAPEIQAPISAVVEPAAAPVAAVTSDAPQVAEPAAEVVAAAPAEEILLVDVPAPGEADDVSVTATRETVQPEDATTSANEAATGSLGAAGAQTSGASGSTSSPGAESGETAAADEATEGDEPAGADSAAGDTAAAGGSGRAPPGPQVIYLDVDGASGVDYAGPVTVTGIDVPAFAAPERLAGQEAAILAALEAAVERELAGQDVVITLERPADGTPYSTIYVGGTDGGFGGYGPLYAVSEQVDRGNADSSDNAFVFSEEIPTVGQTAASYAAEIGTYIAHEAGHLLGYEHARTPVTGTPADALGEVAWKPYTHTEMAKDVRQDVLDDGKVEIVTIRPDATSSHDATSFVEKYDVNPRIVEALTRYEGYYYAGTVGPDGFPDLTFGQRIIHPNDTGTWVARVFDMAWEAQKNVSFSNDEQLQILAFAYGYATHAAGDFFGHTLMNEFSEGVFPAIADIAGGPTAARDAANAIRHLMVEAYIGDATPGFDNNEDVSLLPDGDLAADSTPGTTFEAPMRYIYESLIQPFPGDPTSPADTGAGRTIVAVAGSGTSSFRRTDGGSFLVDGFSGGMQLFSFGFANAANRGKFTIRTAPGSVTADEIQIDQTLVDESGTGDEALVVRGDRGPLLDLVLIAQRKVDDALRGLGGAPSQSFEQILAEIVPSLTDSDPSNDPSAATIETLTRAYLAKWTADIDAGLGEWGRIGLATTKALFDPATRRYWENAIAGGDASDPNRAEDEAAVGTLDIVLAELDDPNRDGRLDDSFLSQYLLPMLGLPKFVGDLRTAIADFGSVLDDLVLAPVRFLFAPITALLSAAKQVVKDFVLGAIEDAFGIDFEQLEQLTSLSSKMDLKSVEINGTVVPIFKPGDHAKIDAYMGIEGEAQSEPLELPAIPGLEFYPDARGRLNDNVEFDKSKFAAYRDSVTLAKLLLLQESDPLGGTTPGTGQLSAFVSRTLTGLSGTATSYDWSKLNVVGQHGGNILTTTLPKSALTAGFDPAAAGIVDAVEDTITLGAGHGLVTGNVVRYDSGAVAGVDAAAIGGLVDNAGYFVRVVDPTKVRLYVTLDDALADANRRQLDASGLASGSHSLRTAALADVQGLLPDGILLATYRVARDSDARPWLRLIDGDQGWRSDTLTVTRSLFVVHAPGTGADYVEWQTPLAAGSYDIQTTWLYNVTQRLDNPITADPTELVNVFGSPVDENVADDHLSPSQLATYVIYDGATELARVTVDQRNASTAFQDDVLGLGFDSLGVFTISTGVLRVQLLESPVGYVSAGPVRAVSQADASIVRIARSLNAETLAESATDGFEAVDSGKTVEASGAEDVGWVNLAYDAGTGNFPLWESARLRPVFRGVFTDWLNGALNFPALGDATSPDPNDDPSIVPSVPPRSYVTPYGAPPAVAPPVGLTLTVVGAETQTYVGTTVIGSIAGNGDATPDSISITVSAATTGVATLFVDLLGNAFKWTGGDFALAGFAAGQEVVARGFSLNNGTFRVASVSGDTLVVVEPVLFGDDSGSGNESIVSPGKLVIAGNVGGGGLTGLTVVADEVTVLPGVVVSTRTTAGSDARSDPSSGDSGAISIEADTISLGAGAAIVAHADAGFSGGDVTLASDVTADSDFRGFRVVGPEATVTLGTGALVTGANVNLSATATTAAAASLGDVVDDLLAVLPASVGFFAALAQIAANLAFLPQAVRDGIDVVANGLEAAEAAFRTAIGNDGVFDLPSGVAAAAVFARADARVDVGNGGAIEASGDVVLTARAVSSVTVTTLAYAG
ncbi:MAG: zinc dependent phospholipase C family protein, partial [Gaiellaceae bacterium]